MKRITDSKDLRYYLVKNGDDYGFLFGDLCSFLDIDTKKMKEYYDCQELVLGNEHVGHLQNLLTGDRCVYYYRGVDVRFTLDRYPEFWVNNDNIVNFQHLLLNAASEAVLAPEFFTIESIVSFANSCEDIINEAIYIEEAKPKCFLKRILDKSNR